MLDRIDRLQLAVPDRRAAAEGWIALLGAEPEAEDRVSCLAAARSRLRLGRGRVELLEPDGAGPVADAVSRRGGHLFAAGASASDPGAVAERLRARGATVASEAGQLFLEPLGPADFGLRMVISPDEGAADEPVGDVDFFYEVTLLARDATSAVSRLADLFALEPRAFVPIESKQYGYAGTLTLFDPDALDRLEVITPNDPRNTMGRFFVRFGEGWYMAFCESGRLSEIETRAAARRVGFTAEPPAEGRTGGADTLFLHPPALGGAMLGVSRRTMAWTWSGHPERVEPRP